MRLLQASVFCLPMLLSALAPPWLPTAAAAIATTTGHASAGHSLRLHRRASAGEARPAADLPFVLTPEQRDLAELYDYMGYLTARCLCKRARDVGRALSCLSSRLLLLLSPLLDRSCYSCSLLRSPSTPMYPSDPSIFNLSQTLKSYYLPSVFTMPTSATSIHPSPPTTRPPPRNSPATSDRRAGRR
jgi:hypothetical protein